MKSKKNVISEMNKLSLGDLYKLSDLMNVGINFNEDENKINDIKGEIIFVLSTESEDKIKKGIERLIGK